MACHFPFSECMIQPLSNSTEGEKLLLLLLSALNTSLQDDPFPDTCRRACQSLVISLLRGVGVGGGTSGLSQLQNLITLKQLVKCPGSSEKTFPCHFNSFLNWEGSSKKE